MSKKNIVFKRHKTYSQDEKKTRSSHHSKINKSIIDQLKEEVNILINNQDKAEAEVRKSHARFEMFKSQGNERGAAFEWMLYQTWS